MLSLTRATLLRYAAVTANLLQLPSCAAIRLLISIPDFLDVIGVFAVGVME